MTRFALFVVAPLACALACVPVGAEDPPQKPVRDELKELKKWLELAEAGNKAHNAGKYAEAAETREEALKLARRLYPKADFPDGSIALVVSLNNLAGTYVAREKLGPAEDLFKEALDMSRKLYKGNHLEVARMLNNVAVCYQAQGKFADAEAHVRESLKMYEKLGVGDHAERAVSVNSLAFLSRAQGRITDAETLYKDSLAMLRRVVGGADPYVLIGLINLGYLYQTQGRFADAEAHAKDALEMCDKLSLGNHPLRANCMNNLALAYQTQGKLTAAEPLYKRALEMREDLFKHFNKGDHTQISVSLNNLAFLYQAQGKLTDAEPLYKRALEMNQRLFPNTPHPDVARSLNNLAFLYRAQGKLTDAESRTEEALAMYKKLFTGDHPDIAGSLNNLAVFSQMRGRLADAERGYKEAIAINQRVSKGDHDRLVMGLTNLGFVYQIQGKWTDAELRYREAAEMSRRLLVVFAEQKSEGDALTLLASQGPARDSYLSLTRTRAAVPGSVYDPATAYPVVWGYKGAVTRVYEQRQLRTRAETKNPELAAMVGELAGARRRRAELLLAPATKDPGTLSKREADLKALERTIADLSSTLPKRFPEVDRVGKLNAASAADLQGVLPEDTAMVDLVRYLFVEYDDTKPVGQKLQSTARYLAFVLTRKNVVRVELDTAEQIERGVSDWRTAITRGGEILPGAPAKVRELVWAKVRKELPAGTKTVYICPDAALCRVPWAALPGDKPGTVLLEDYAVATVPHAPFLLDKLGAQSPANNPRAAAIVVGGVKYDSEPATKPLPIVVGTAPLIAPGAKLEWVPLDGTIGEANGVGRACADKNLTVLRFEGEKATVPAILAALPKAKFAHFATHGFFADPSFRGLFDLNETDFRQSQLGERIGRAANSPLVMTGLVFAGANNSNAPGRGVLTGEALIDLDLGGLDLAVLSACDTGLGDVAGGEGTFGLQRAFHYAGTRDVVASLWKVPDAATAALMARFYENLWTKNLPPIEALRQAQLSLYRNPANIPAWAKEWTREFKVVKDHAIKPNNDGTAHPRDWAAFTLSGPGR